MITAGARFAVPLAGLIMAGCGLVTSRAAPPTTARAIDPAAEWSEIKANAPAHATLTVSVRPTQPENIVTIIPSARVRIVPYASGLWEELSTLLRWKYESDVSAAQRDQASRRLDEAIARYEEALATAGLRDLSHSFVVSLGAGPRGPARRQAHPGRRQPVLCRRLHDEQRAVPEPVTC